MKIGKKKCGGSIATLKEELLDTKNSRAHKAIAS